MANGNVYCGTIWGAEKRIHEEYKHQVEYYRSIVFENTYEYIIMRGSTTHGNPSNSSSCPSRWTNGWNEAQYPPPRWPWDKHNAQQQSQRMLLPPCMGLYAHYLHHYCIGQFYHLHKERIEWIGWGNATFWLDLINIFLCKLLLQALLNYSHSFPIHIFLWFPGDESYISNAEAKSLLELHWDNDPGQ